MNKQRLYAAYGSNLNLTQMSQRCPTAQVVGVGILKDYQLTFRGVATVEPMKNSETPVGIWSIQPSDEAALDTYEGYPRLYRKEMVEVDVNGEKIEAMIYVMNLGTPRLPYRGYLDTIAQGYDETGIDKTYLKNALRDTQIRMKRIRA